MTWGTHSPKDKSLKGRIANLQNGAYTLTLAAAQTVFAVILRAVPEDLKADRRFLWTYVHLTRVTDKAIREYNVCT
jgi:hypothetical protein